MLFVSVSKLQNYKLEEQSPWEVAIPSCSSGEDIRLQVVCWKRLQHRISSHHKPSQAITRFMSICDLWVQYEMEAIFLQNKQHNKQ